MDENLPVIRISVRNLVEFILREGDIDNRTGGGQDPENMQMGSRIHRKIQRQMGSDYQAEVPLKTEIVCDGFTLKIEGRADGLIHTKEQVMVDEIKGVLRELDRVQEPAGIHQAQAKCYARKVAELEGAEEIGVQMTYCQMETEEVKRFQYSYQSNELKVWFDEVIRQYKKWAKFQIEWRKARNASIKGIEFPFPYRKGQRELAVTVYRTILRKKKLFIQAPTGVGKTISTVFPAVKAVGEELGEKIFYLTAKTITRTVAEQAFKTLREQNLKFKVITLTAKEKICFCEEAECNPDACPYAKGHFDRVNDAVFDLIAHSGDWSREVLEEQAKKHMVCPFEMSLDEFSKLSLTAENVIPITAQCTVFAESEVITLVGEGKPQNEIAAGIQQAVAKRCFVMAKKAGAKDAITLTGGCAKNQGLKAAFEKVLRMKGIELKIDPQLMGALGAAEYARQKGLDL